MKSYLYILLIFCSSLYSANGIAKVIDYSGKATLLSNNSQVIFSIPMDVTKKNVKEAVEKLFRVNVKKINIIVSKGKTKRFKGKVGRRKNEKKAIISLEKGQKIDITTGI